MIKRLLSILVVLMLAGCAAIDNFEEKHDADVYFKVGVGAQIDALTDILMRTSYKDACGVNAKAIFGPGVEWKQKHELELIHESSYFCGYPFNEKPEMYSLDLRYMYAWGKGE